VAISFWAAANCKQGQKLLRCFAYAVKKDAAKYSHLLLMSSGNFPISDGSISLSAISEVDRFFLIQLFI
jgi:hypothetical protein